MFVAATEAFSRRNINCSIAESLERAQPVFDAAKAHGVRVRGYVSCVLGCPYEGDVDPARVADVAGALHATGRRTRCRSATRSAPAPRARRRR